jgi:diguanylate cyclase (GGDEF)-like protein
VLRSFASLAVILSFDQLGFFIGLHLVTGTPLSALFGGWVAKMGAAATYAAFIGIYLTLFERTDAEPVQQPLSDIFHKLTYRHKYEELLGKSSQDALTGALTRERFEALGGPTIARGLSAGMETSLLILDIDHFKSINDRYGHVVGDEVLNRVVDCVRSEIRGEDRIFRYGGEEFVVLCENTGHAAALVAAERMRLAVHQRLALEFDAAPTISIGVATSPQDGSAIRDLLAKADARLYAAKREGRNRVVGSDPEGEQPQSAKR